MKFVRTLVVLMFASLMVGLPMQVGADVQLLPDCRDKPVTAVECLGQAADAECNLFSCTRVAAYAFSGDGTLCPDDDLCWDYEGAGWHELTAPALGAAHCMLEGKASNSAATGQDGRFFWQGSELCATNIGTFGWGGLQMEDCWTVTGTTVPDFGAPTAKTATADCEA